MYVCMYIYIYIYIYTYIYIYIYIYIVGPTHARSRRMPVYFVRWASTGERDARRRRGGAELGLHAMHAPHQVGEDPAVLA